MRIGFSVIALVWMTTAAQSGEAHSRLVVENPVNYTPRLEPTNAVPRP